MVLSAFVCMALSLYGRGIQTLGLQVSLNEYLILKSILKFQ